MGLRREGRELALKALYQIDIGGDSSTESLAALFDSFGSDGRSRDFALALINGVKQGRTQLDTILAEALTNWSIERLSRVDHNILRMATFELREMSDVPTRVTIDEAIELAKRYGDRDSGPFVNGVLDVVATRLGVKGKGDGDGAALKAD